MQWRSLIMLFSGLAVIYIAVLSQDTHYLHPKIIYTSNHPRIVEYSPDKLIISTVGSYIYLTAIKYEALKSKGSLIGTGNIKLGVRGYVKQMRKPISNLLTERDVLEIDGWTTCFEHELKGPITKISEKNSYEDSQTQFAILYHQVENDNSLHYVRIYYTTTNEEGNGFKYKDILLPGSTWINAISLENDSLIYSRDPDQYEFHIMTLPSQLLEAPHSTLTTDLSEYHINHGRLVQEWSQPISTEQYSNLLARLYSPINETYRVFTLSVHKTPSKFYVNITIADNATITNKENKPMTTWFQREKGESKYPVYNEDTTEYIGFSDMSSYQNMQYAERVSMPDLYATVSSQSSTIVFPYIKNKFITLDYTDRVDILAKIKTERERLYSNDGRKTIIPEYYYWQGYETVDAEIKGVQLNKEGDVLALWTEFNDVYIYTRQGKQDNNRHSGLLTKFDEMVDYLLSDISEEEKSLRDTYFPAPWQLEMAIAPTKDTYGRTKAVGSVHFWDNKYIFVGLKDGNVNSYRIDQHEAHKSADFWSFADDRWDMLFAMSMVIAIFVYNENQRP